MKSRITIGRVITYIALIILAVSIIVPVGWVFLASIKENNEFYGNPWTLPKGFHFQNFSEAFSQARMGSYFFNSVMVTVIALALLLILALPAAYVLSRYKFRGNKLLNLAFMAGLFINVSYIVVPIFLMLVDGNKFLKQIFGGNVSFFLNNIFIMGLIYASTALPFTIYLLSSYFKTLPKDFEEAAYVDGAGYFKTMTAIILPMAKPSIIAVILFNFLAFWNEYIIAVTIMTEDTAKTLPVGLMNLMAAQNAKAEYGKLYAGLVIVMLPTLILYMIVQKQLIQGMTAGGIKG